MLPYSNYWNPYDHPIAISEDSDSAIQPYLYPHSAENRMDTDTRTPLQPQHQSPILSNNKAEPQISLFKELSGYPRYGNPSSNADMLYTGNRGSWTFDVAPFMMVPNRADIVLHIRAILDDHYKVPTDRYSAIIRINGHEVWNGRLPLPHGQLSGNQFINWSTLTFPISSLRRQNHIVVLNTSNTGPMDWIAFDWMEIRFLPR